MALYSVWDWDKNAWAVYRTSEPVSVGDDPKPPRPMSVSALGADPDTQIKSLPPTARFVGYDHMCRGEVRRRGGMPLGLDAPEASDIPKYALGFGLGVGVAYYFMRRRRA